MRTLPSFLTSYPSGGGATVNGFEAGLVAQARVEERALPIAERAASTNRLKFELVVAKADGPPRAGEVGAGLTGPCASPTRVNVTLLNECAKVNSTPKVMSTAPNMSS